MDEIIPTVNMVVYLVASPPQSSPKHKRDCYAGGHGYTYDLTQEGKKKLVKDVPTSTGYYTGNVNRPNTVIAVQDIVSLTVAAVASPLEAVLHGLQIVLENFVMANSVYRNLYLVTPFKELDLLFKLKPDQWTGETIKLGKTQLNKAETALAKTCYLFAEDMKKFSTPKHIVVDLDGSAEGGMGNRQVTKQLELAQVITQFGYAFDLQMTITGRKEYENPESDFNKLLTSNSRWFFDTQDEEAYYRVEDDYRIYDFGRVEPKKNYYGKITPDVTYSRLYTKKPIELLDKLFKFTQHRIANPEGYLLAGDLRNITNKDIVRMIDSTPGVVDKRTLVSPFTRGNDKPMLIELISPTLMAYKVREHLTSLDILLQTFKKKDENNVFGYTKFYNITDLIYVKEVNGKGVTKLKLHPDFTQARQTFTISVEHPSAVKPVPIMLSIGFDIPDRNAFNAVEDPNVEVWVAVDTRNQQGLRYSSLVKADDFVYVHTSAEANLRVLTLAELGKKKAT